MSDEQIVNNYELLKSYSLNKDDLIKERRLLNEICLRQQMHMADIVGNEFDTVN